jgi:DNA-binding transcriptional LysR family regulator
MALDVDRLLVLVEVAHAGSIAGAAKRMSLTASALSQQLGKLEREVGRPLLDRGPRGVRLTEAGAALVAHGEVVLGELRAAEEMLSSGGHQQRLAIGTFTTAGVSLVPEALATFRRRHPDVRLSLQDLEPPGGYGLVTSGELDLLITHRYPGIALPDARGLRRARLLVDPLLLVLTTGHRLAGSTDIDLAELSEEDWICGAPGVANRITLEHLAAGSGFTPHVAYETQDYQVTLALLAAGLGIALVPASVLRQAGVGDCQTHRLRGPRPVREVYVVHRARPLPLVADVVTLLRGVAQRHVPSPDPVVDRERHSSRRRSP